MSAISLLRGLHVAASLLRSALWVTLSLPEVLLALAGIRPAKTMRVIVIVQRDEAGLAVASGEAVAVQLDWAAEAFWKAANVRLLGQVVTEDLASTGLTLDVRGFGDGAVADNFGRPGAAFRLKTLRLGPCGAPLRRLTGYGAPIVLFAVRGFVGGHMNGASFGVTADHALIVFGCNPATLAHEVGHSCMLLHRGDCGNLMHRSWPRGAALTRWQAAVLRASRHVTFF